jgi:hypothetical protein
MSKAPAQRRVVKAMGLMKGGTLDRRGLKYPEWQIPLEEAIVEPDLAKLRTKVHTVETLIFKRLKELESSKDGIAERDAINTGLNILRIVKHERLGFPDWK